MMEQDALDKLKDRLGDYEIFGEAVREGDTTLVPVGEVQFGGGWSGQNGENGGGGGVQARVIGAFSVKGDGTVTWHPAVSVNRIVWGGQLALATAIVACAIAFRRRSPSSRTRSAWRCGRT
ncbi:hypothetical protein EIL87_24870 [Saccharopolyspora rhizosphaerae]|uniref:Sporulation protein n=1 Tax=Saccharopolyspora rhizosphaerae TaxID=2492662 RepID=A0A426JIF9_9PSEU|nr:hypothetical protein [Saccharopolyspora rhizosphaerae]RRO12907.1 hypothetical protein EIL87_24870 [Saccharopolyspora rhizosphaerae]